MAPAASLTITEYVFSPKKKKRSGKIRLLWGKVKCFVNDYTGYREKKFNVTTNTAIIGVRGTVFVVVMNPDGSMTVAAYDNDLFVQTAGMEGDFVILVEGTTFDIKKGELPGDPRKLTPRDKQLLDKGLFSVTPDGTIVTNDGRIIFDATTTTYGTTTSTSTTSTTTTTTSTTTTTTTTSTTTTSTTTTSMYMVY